MGAEVSAEKLGLMVVLLLLAVLEAAVGRLAQWPTQSPAGHAATFIHSMPCLPEQGDSPPVLYHHSKGTPQAVHTPTTRRSKVKVSCVAA